MKKILNFLLIIAIIFLGNWIVLASWKTSRGLAIKQVVLKKIEIEKKIPKWDAYINSINNYFKRYSNNQKALQAIQNRVLKVKANLWNDEKDKKLKLLIEYIEHKTHLWLLTISNTQSVTIDWNSDSLNKIELRKSIEIAKKQILSFKNHPRFTYENLWYSALVNGHTWDYNYMNEFTRFTWWKNSFIHNAPDNECYFYSATNRFIWDGSKSSDFIIMGINKETKEKEYYSSKNDIIIENIESIDCENWPKIAGFLAAIDISTDYRLNHALRNIVLTIENQKVIDDAYENITWSNFREIMIATNFSNIPIALEFLEKQWCVFYWKHKEESYASFLALYNEKTKKWSYESYPNISPIVENDFYSSTSCETLPVINKYNVIKVLN